MVRVVCQVLVHPKRITFRWSEAKTYFEPYHLEGTALNYFWQASELCRNRLCELVDTEANSDSEQGQAAFALAQAGRRLFEHVFPRQEPNTQLVDEIRDWLTQCYDAGQVESLEIIGETLGVVPWNLVYDREPQEAEFQNAVSDNECWRPFWGIRYALATTQSVNALRSVEWLETPQTLLVVDPQARLSLPDDARRQLTNFSDEHSLKLVESLDHLSRELYAAAPDVVYFFGRADENGLWIGDAALSPAALKERLVNSEMPQIPWNNLLVIINPVNCERGSWQSLRRQLFNLRLGGLVAPDVPTSAERANQIGLDILDGFLKAGDPLGVLAQNKRSAHAPFGLVWTTACPPRLQSTPADGIASDEEGDDDDLAALLPDEPYRPMIPLDREERALLAARDDDINICAELIDGSRTRIMMLHGRPGVGKSSLLRSGVIPFLDREALGYHALRDRQPGDEPLPPSEKDYPVISIRCTNDLIGQLALALSAFVAEPLSYKTPTGRQVEVDLAGLVRGDLRGGHSWANDNAATDSSISYESHGIQADGQQLAVATESRATKQAGTGMEPGELRTALIEDHKLFGQVLVSLGQHLPWELVLLIEQGEELYSLSRVGEDVRMRKLAVAMLAAFAEQPSHAKIVMSLRTEYFGRLASLLQQHLADVSVLSSQLLSSLNANQLAQVILQPTLDEDVAYSDDIPFEHYHFRFAEHLPRRMALEAIRSANEGNEEALPLLQAVCFLLYAQLDNRADRIIRDEDLQAVGGVAGGIERYLQRAWNAVVLPNDSRRMLLFLEKFYHEQPDGLLTRALVTEEELVTSWRGRTALPSLLETATDGDIQLLEETVILSDNGESSGFSLGHDACLPVLRDLVEKDRFKKHGRGRIVDTLYVAIPAMIVLGVIGYVFLLLPRIRTIGEYEEALTEQQKQIAKGRVALQRAENNQWPRYLGQIHQAHSLVQDGDLLRARQLLLTQKRNAKFVPRGFEWFYLWRLIHGERKSLVGHQAEIVGLAPENDLLISAAADDRVYLWDTKSLRQFGHVKVKPGSVSAVAAAPGGDRFATAGNEKTIKIISLKEKGNIRELAGHKAPVTALAFLPDKKSLLSASEDHTIKLWDVDKGKELHTFNGHDKAVRTLAIDPKSDQFASAGDDGKVIIWDLKKQKKLQELKVAAAALAFAPDGATLVSVGNKRENQTEIGKVTFRDTTTGKVKGKEIAIGALQLAVIFSADGKTLLTAGKDNVIHLFDVAKREEIGNIQGHLGWVTSLALSADGKTLFSGSFDGTIKAWEFPPPPNAIQSHDDGVLSFAVSPTKLESAAGGRDGTIKIWSLVDGANKRTLKEHNGPVTGLGYGVLEDKLLLASCDEGSEKKPGRLLIWDEKGKIHKELNGHKSGILSLAFALDGKTLMSAGDDGELKIWDVQSGKEKFSLKDHNEIIRVLVPSPDRETVAGAGDSGRIYLWNTNTGKLLHDADLMRHPFGAVHALAFFPDGQYLASGSADQTIKLWAVAKGEEFDTLRGHSGAVNSLAFSPLDATLVSGGADGSVKLWFVGVRFRGMPSFTFTEHKSPVRSVAFAPDLSMIISADSDGKIQIRRAAPRVE